MTEEQKHERVALSVELERINWTNISGMKAADRLELQARHDEVKARIGVLDETRDHETWWRALSNEQRHDLLSMELRLAGCRLSLWR